MRAFWLVCLLLVSCGGPVTEGVWLFSERMSHRCRTATDLGIVCEDDSSLDPGRREGTVQIEDLGGGRLRRVDVDGRITVGQDYSDGARFRWLERRSSDAGDCVETSDTVLELVGDALGLSGQRRVFADRSEGCGTANTSDEGFVVTATPVEVMR